MDDKKPILHKAELEPEDEESLTVEVVTYGGKQIDLTDPVAFAEAVDINHIAHSLAMQCRYNGSTSCFYSVAEHCVILAEYVLKKHQGESFCIPLAKCLLMHDAAEAYLGDVVQPLKEIQYEYCVFEAYVEETIRKKFLLLDDYTILHDLIKKYDRSICIDEMEQLFEFTPNYVKTILENPEYERMNIQVRAWTPMQAKEEFLKIATKLELI